MSFSNPRMPWPEMAQRLAGHPPEGVGDGGDSPAWARRRPDYRAPGGISAVASGGYAELHCHSNFSFLDGASHPEALVEEAARLGLSALALTDHHGFAGAVRFARAAGEVGVRTVFGAELTLGLSRPQAGRADPEGRHLVVLARDAQGYAALSSAISRAQLQGEKGAPRFSLEDLATAHRGSWEVLTGCRKGVVPMALASGGERSALRELQRLQHAFGREHVHVELWDHHQPLDGERNDALASVAGQCGASVVATNVVHYATARSHRMAAAVAAIRARRSLDAIDGWLPPHGSAHLRSAEQMRARFDRHLGAVRAAEELGLACAFDLRLVAPALPDCRVPDGHTEATWLRALTEAGAERRYGTRRCERVQGAYAQIDHELQVIEQLGFPGYFLIVWDIMEFCRRSNIYAQGRGSAANSAVCFALGITNVDAVGMGLLFERFLSPERDGPPDIDVDIESGRREEVIQYVYERYGRDRAAQVCNVITYRPKSAVRDAAKAHGYSQGQQDAWSKQVDHWSLSPEGCEGIPTPVLELAIDLQDVPRHLGIHSGGMVLCDRPVIEVCPVERARMADRTVLQWDKEDCAAVGLVKFDLLGLGMLSMLHHAIDLLREVHGVDIDLATIPQEDPAVYDMLCEADSLGVFQVESRAQMSTLPRLKPRTFYDLVVEVALIRPGPIQGGSVHPYIRRRNGEEEPTFLHEALRPSLRRTLGVPLFQEQLMQMAVDAAGFTPAEADQLRQAIGSKRSHARMERLRERLLHGMRERGVDDEAAGRIYEQLLAFANFGFPESHAVSFAHLVYASAWIKRHYPAAFLAALLRSQPMGFWSPQSLAADARRHGVELLGPDVNASEAVASVVDAGTVRMGIGGIRTIGEATAAHIAAGRPYADMEDVVRRNELSLAQVEALATAGAFGCFDIDRRRALWIAGAVVHARDHCLPGMLTGTVAPTLPFMSEVDEVAADLWSTGLSPGRSPVQFVRDDLTARGVVTAVGLRSVAPGSKVRVAGVVTHRRPPATARGITFLNLEDETGMVNIICSRGLWSRHRKVARTAVALIVSGRLEQAQGVVNVVAEKLEALWVRGGGSLRSRDFH